MAVAFIGSTSANWASNAVTINDPGTAGAFLIAVICHQSGAENNWTPPAGWTLLQSGICSFVGAQMIAWYRPQAVGSGSYAFADTDVAGQGFGMIFAWSGADPTTPVDVSGETYNSVGVPAGWAVSAPSVTTTTANGLLVHIASVDPSSTLAGTMTYTAAAGYTARGNGLSTSQASTIFVCDKQLGAAGATGAASSTINDSGDAGSAGTLGFHVSVVAAPPGNERIAWVTA